MCIRDSDRFIPSIKEITRIAITFILVVLGWIIFRAESLQHAIGYFSGMINQSLFDVPNFRDISGTIGGSQMCYTLIFICILQIVEWSMRKRCFGLDFGSGSHWMWRWTVYLSIIVLLTVFSGEQEKFIYFQF